MAKTKDKTKKPSDIVDHSFCNWGPLEHLLQEQTGWYWDVAGVYDFDNNDPVFLKLGVELHNPIDDNNSFADPEFSVWRQWSRAKQKQFDDMVVAERERLYGLVRPTVESWFKRVYSHLPIYYMVTSWDDHSVYVLNGPLFGITISPEANDAMIRDLLKEIC